MSFVEIEFALRGADSETLSDALEALGALSVSFKDQADDPVLEPLPGEFRLWPNTAVVALFDDSLPDASRLKQLTDHLGVAVSGAICRTIEDRAWEREWLKDWTALRFGRRLWICPTASEPPPDEDAVVVWLDPGLAFGTGTHPTTAQCLEMLDATDLTGSEVIDYGCGSGILCIAALKLGAAAATAVDLDPQALLATRDNAERNGVSERLRVQAVDLPLAPAEIVLANILAGPLIELAPLLLRACRPQGHLILSGILADQGDQLLAAYEPWFDIVVGRQRDGWACFHLRRRPVA